MGSGELQYHDSSRKKGSGAVCVPVPAKKNLSVWCFKFASQDAWDVRRLIGVWRVLQCMTWSCTVALGSEVLQGWLGVSGGAA